jgi:hypothetical protein
VGVQWEKENFFFFFWKGETKGGWGHCELGEGGYNTRGEGKVIRGLQPTNTRWMEAIAAGGGGLQVPLWGWVMLQFEEREVRERQRHSLKNGQHFVRGVSHFTPTVTNLLLNTKIIFC